MFGGYGKSSKIMIAAVRKNASNTLPPEPRGRNTKEDSPRRPATYCTVYYCTLQYEVYFACYMHSMICCLMLYRGLLSYKPDNLQGIFSTVASHKVGWASKISHLNPLSL